MFRYGFPDQLHRCRVDHEQCTILSDVVGLFTEQCLFASERLCTNLQRFWNYSPGEYSGSHGRHFAWNIHGSCLHNTLRNSHFLSIESAFAWAIHRRHDIQNRSVRPGLPDARWIRHLRRLQPDVRTSDWRQFRSSDSSSNVPYYLRQQRIPNRDLHCRNCQRSRGYRGYCNQ